MLLCLLALTVVVFAFLVFFDATPATLLSTLSLHDALPISAARRPQRSRSAEWFPAARRPVPGAFDSGPARLVRRAAPVYLDGRSTLHTRAVPPLRRRRVSEAGSSQSTWHSRQREHCLHRPGRTPAAGCSDRARPESRLRRSGAAVSGLHSGD